MAKYYFSEFDDEVCGTIEYQYRYMEEHNISQMTLIEAERETNTGYFHCNHFENIREVGQGCGKMCEAYKPRNKKNGRCIHSGYVYTLGEKKKIIKSKPKQLCLNI